MKNVIVKGSISSKWIGDLILALVSRDFNISSTKMLTINL